MKTTSKRTHTILAVTIASIAVFAMCLQTTRAFADAQVTTSKNMAMSSHITTGGPFGVLGLSVQRDIIPSLTLEVGGGYDMQSASFTDSFRASGRVHLHTPLSSGRNTISAGLFAGLGYDSLEAEQGEDSFILTTYYMTGAYENLVTFNAGASLNLVTPTGFRLGFEMGLVDYLAASHFEDFGDFDREATPRTSDFDKLPAGEIYAGINAGFVF